MADAEWMFRLRRFASTGVWPASEGNRPSPRQTKWYDLYQQIEKCPRMSHGQRSLFGDITACTCGFHTQMAADEKSIPGYHQVDSLAEYLVELREQTALCLNSQQVDTIISLWQSLHDHDKQQVVYAARLQDRLLSGRFRTPDKPSTTPGVESATLCMLCASCVPAQWPDCCRLIENIFIRLCNLHPSPLRHGKKTDSRWSLILRDYHRIGQLVVGNALVMQGTDIQLVEVNQNTLIQWYNHRQKRQELSVPLQGTVLPPALPVSAQPFKEEEPIKADEEHQNQSTPTAPGPFLAPQVVPQAVVIQIFLPMVVVQGTNTAPRTVVPSTQKARASTKRPYKRTVQANTCKQCGQFRTAETGHSQYRGRVYCPVKETQTKEQWLEEMRRKFSK